MEKKKAKILFNKYYFNGEEKKLCDVDKLDQYSFSIKRITSVAVCGKACNVGVPVA